MGEHRRGHGEGAIYQRASDGKWVAVAELPRAPLGARRRKVIYGRTRRDVADKLRKLHAELDGGAVFDGGRQTVNDILDKRIASTRLSPATRESYDKAARLHIRPLIGRIRLDKLAHGHLQHAIDKATETSTGMAAVVWVVLSGALRPLVKAGFIKAHVLDLVEVPTYEAPKIAPLTLQQARRLLEVIRGNRFELAYRLALSIGLRIGEVFGLHKADLDRDKRELSISRQVGRTKIGGLGEKKTKSESGNRLLAMPAVLFDDLATLIDADQQPGCPWLFHTRTGRPVAPNDVRKRFKTMLKRAGLPETTRFHDLRHSCATFLIAQGVHPRVIQEILGHSTIGITMNTYGHVLPEVSRDAAERIGDMLRTEE